MKDDIVSVRPQFGRNNLLLPGLAIYASPENLELRNKRLAAKTETEAEKHSSRYSGMVCFHFICFKATLRPFQLNLYFIDSKRIISPNLGYYCQQRQSMDYWEMACQSCIQKSRILGPRWCHWNVQAWTTNIRTKFRFGREAISCFCQSTKINHFIKYC